MPYVARKERFNLDTDELNNQFSIRIDDYTSC